MNREDQERQNLISLGIKDFLEDNDLYLSAQNFERVKLHLAKCFISHSSISRSTINNFLSELFEYNDLNRKALDYGAKSEEQAENLIVDLILTSENKKKKPSVKLWFGVIVLFLIVAELIVLFIPTSLNDPITVAQTEEIKNLVAKVVKIEKDNNNKTSHQTVWSVLKKLEQVTAYKKVSSYKEFNYGQYIEVKKELLDWIKRAEMSLSPNKGVTYTFLPHEITVVDGDTFKTKNNKFRLWGIDAFEKNQDCFNQFQESYQCGKIADQVLYNIISTSSKIDCVETAKDKYKRSIARCKVNGVELGEILVKSGYALDYTRYSGGHFKEAEKTAKASKVGAWVGCFRMPWDYRHGKNKDLCTGG